ncbi:MAG TPA: tRNA pseudouridine(55) synthase TruB [Polyangiaceae bacterium]|nr:MAG: tRNA pseudouridine synthase B [Deltaproteobacteria bacterium ADurb.Bin207]HNS95784.1 tRNA pseudouridine(55) synthase TruB [Polyangiaceae bacterium]HNZ24613.1 tRNA pseudouridine(55) synthase TruB [Polyangiaceae bacterium]HOD25673.1 tRNA pseudouridine(55) synthase TruB [Polyangiaceae bacterium]HOE50999.1 tRNA pseudouridine(55) synthase TruB [Polyangiaceae bacterium]
MKPSSNSSSSSSSKPSGLLLIDKPSGPTSHDVVARVRRALQTRSVGHAGTLDPMASGVLVVMVGSCTKLSSYLTLEDKVYRARILLGYATDTLDAEGSITDSATVPAALLSILAHIEKGHFEQNDRQALHHALVMERNRTLQVPPSYSAIKRDGVASYQRARRGEQLELPARDVRVHRLDLVGATMDPPSVIVEVHVSKGYYVRALARDLGRSLELPSHLMELRRLRSGAFGLEDTITLDADARAMNDAMLSVEQTARRCLPVATLTRQGACRALRGQALGDDDFAHPPIERVSAWFSEEGRLVAIGDRSRGRPTVCRAFLHIDEMC